MRPVLSVALCTFNGCKYLKEQLLSIVGQELIVDEIVICDDCSNDETLSIIKEIQDRCPEITWNVQRNSYSLGVTKNFEKALSLCTGDIIFLSDQDDVWLPSKTRCIVEYFERHPEVNLVFTDAVLIDGNGVLKTSKTLFDACGLRQLMGVWNSGLQFEIENVIQRLLGATFGVRRSFVQYCLPFSNEVNNYHDGQLAMHSVVQKCNGMIDECLIQYRIHGSNVVGLGGENNWVYGRKESPDEMAQLVEPRLINPFFLLPYADAIRERVDFYKKRVELYSRFMGKVCLIILFYKYIYFYKQYWWRFFVSDVLYGVSDSVRVRLLATR